MAVIDGLTTLSLVKLDLGLTDSTHNTLLEQLINGVSNQILAYLDREIKRTVHTTELYAVNNAQTLLLKNYPVQTLSECKLGGVVLNIGTDVILEGESGRLYRAQGWIGNYYTRGTFPDIFSGARDISVTYTSGYYLPADGSYSAGAATSLPLAITMAANRAVSTTFRVLDAQSQGLKSFTEGGISQTWIDSFPAGSTGFDPVTLGMLSLYKRREAVG